MITAVQIPFHVKKGSESFFNNRTLDNLQSHSERKIGQTFVVVCIFIVFVFFVSMCVCSVLFAGMENSGWIHILVVLCYYRVFMYPGITGVLAGSGYTSFALLCFSIVFIITYFSGLFT